jgi:putative flippase GtrA
MFTFFKANIASLVASAFDYGITIIAVQFFSINVVIAGIIGTCCGAITHFIIGRHWVFLAQQSKFSGQAKKYLLVWSGNLLLNATGMYVFTKIGVNYIITKVGTSILVGVAYNYPLQKGYVFKTGKYENFS